MIGHQYKASMGLKKHTSYTLPSLCMDKEHKAHPPPIQKATGSGCFFNVNMLQHISFSYHKIHPSHTSGNWGVWGG